jgi:hypothetical protein
MVCSFWLLLNNLTSWLCSLQNKGDKPAQRRLAISRRGYTCPMARFFADTGLQPAQQTQLLLVWVTNPCGAFFNVP